MKFNPHTNHLFTDDGRLIKRLHCPFRLDWNKLGPTDDPGARNCDICQHAVTDTAQFEGLEHEPTAAESLAAGVDLQQPCVEVTP